MAMHTKHLLFGLVCYCALFSFPVHGQEGPDSYLKPVETQEEYCPLDNPRSFRYSTVHREANGIGYDQGYTSFNGFFAFKSIRNWHPFFDLRTHFFNDWRVAANAGFGLRYQPNTVQAIFGINGFFDYRNLNDATFEQAGIGLEALGVNWFSRVNGYLPIIQRNYLYDVDFTGFEENSAVFTVKRELAFKGFDLSLGRTLFRRQYYSLTATLAGYMFFADYQKTAKGGLFKLDTDISRYFSAQVQTSYDNLFKGIVQGQLALNVPFGKKVKARKKGLSCSAKTALADRLMEKVDRFEIIVADKYRTESLAKNPDTDQDLFIVFVDNLTQGGNGTAESPFATLAQAESSSSPGDMIYVYGGTSTTTGMDQGITLQDNQWLQGSGRSFLVLTDFGVDEIPAQTTNWPTIGNPTGNTITLANNNKVVGLNLISSDHNIYGLETQGASISYNNLAGSSMSDMYFENSSGILNITHNNSRSASGLVLTTDENLTLNLQNNVLINNGQVNLDLTFLGNSTSNASLRFNTLEQSTDGSIIDTQDSANLTLNYQGNRMQHTKTSSDSVITFSAEDSSRMIVVAEDNYLAAPPLQGYEFITSGQALTFFYVEENSGTYTGSEDEAYPFTFTVNNSSISNLLLSGNTANSSGYLLTNNSSAASFNVQSPTLSLSGVQDLNTGTVSTAGSGTITFISYTPSSTPQLD